MIERFLDWAKNEGWIIERFMLSPITVIALSRSVCLQPKATTHGQKR